MNKILIIAAVCFIAGCGNGDSEDSMDSRIVTLNVTNSDGVTINMNDTDSTTISTTINGVPTNSSSEADGEGSANIVPEPIITIVSPTPEMP